MSFNDIEQRPHTVFTTLLRDVKRAADNAVKWAHVSALIDLLATVALFFFTLAAFIWAEGKYGAIAASFGLGVFYLALATATFVVARVRRRSLAPQVQTRQAQQQALLNEREQSAIDSKWLPSSVAIAIVAEILRLIGARKNAPEGARKLVPLIALSTVVLAALLAVARGKSSTDEQPK